MIAIQVEPLGPWLRPVTEHPARSLFRASLLTRAARVLHPDVAGDRVRWDKLESARRILRGDR